MKILLRHTLAGFLILLILASCSGGSSTDEAAVVVESYFQALVDRDLDGIINITCQAWEEQAILEFDSFSAATIRIEGLDCQVTSTEGDYAVVDCQGVIIADNGGEDQEFKLQGNHYQTLFEDGGWRMCGYH
jgi:hypothetical protein